MKAILLAETLLLSCFAFADNKPAWCGLTEETQRTMSPGGLPQLSNLSQMDITCSIPARPFPSKPGETRSGLQARTNVYELLDDGSKRAVASDVIVHGGGSEGWDGNPVDWVGFYAYIPLDPPQRDEEVLKFLTQIEAHLAPEQLTNEERQNAMKAARDIVDHTQLRVGHFQIECSVLDGADVVGVGFVELIIVNKGRLSDPDPADMSTK